MKNKDDSIMVILSSPSGVGKTTLTKKIQQKYQSFKISVSHTTRKPRANEIDGVDYGVSPRATIALDLCARAQAWLQARDFVTPEDIQTVINDVFRHRLILTYEATARGITADSVTNELINTVPVP